MRKFIALLLLLACSYRIVLAQNKTLDSLNQLLATEKEDTSRVLLMSRIGILYTTSKPDTAMEFPKK
jgi:hypothetical protein